MSQEKENSMGLKALEVGNNKVSHDPVNASASSKPNKKIAAEATQLMTKDLKALTMEHTVLSSKLINQKVDQQNKVQYQNLQEGR